MKIKWNGHASFTITADDGTVLVTDPYDPSGYDGALTYDVVDDKADGALISHDHADHNNVNGLSGSPDILKGSGNIKDISVKGINTFHDESRGSERGSNIVFVFKVDGINICFMGDLGHQLSDEQIKEAGKVDLLLVPVGGTFTVDAEGASNLIDAVKPRLVIPMHYKTSKCNFPIGELDSFLDLMSSVKKLGKTEIEISADQISEQGSEVWVMDYAC